MSLEMSLAGHGQVDRRRACDARFLTSAPGAAAWRRYILTAGDGTWCGSPAPLTKRHATAARLKAGATSANAAPSGTEWTAAVSTDEASMAIDPKDCLSKVGRSLTASTIRAVLASSLNRRRVRSLQDQLQGCEKLRRSIQVDGVKAARAERFQACLAKGCREACWRLESDQ